MKEVIKVLLVDGDEEYFFLTKTLFDDFKSGKYLLDWSNDADGALEQMKASSHDIYLIDNNFGKQKGLETIRQALAGGCRSPIILLTEQSDEKTEAEAVEAGATDYLIKWFEVALLEKAMRYCLLNKRAQENIETAETKFRSVIESANDAIFLVDNLGKVILWNKAAEKIYGYTEDEILGKSAVLLMAEKYAKKALEVGVKDTLEKVLAPLSGQMIQGIGRRRDGTEFPIEMSGTVWSTSEGVFYTAVVRDITVRRLAEAQLVHEATHDPLTGLPNRAQFTNILQDVIRYAQKTKRFNFAVLFLDLDGFKWVNDNLGHVAGDKLLVSIADRLKSSVRPGDVVSRFGGDEFTLLLHSVRTEKDAIFIADRLQKTFAETFPIDGHEITSSASIGIMLGNRTHHTPEEFLRDADAAMYRAKQSGKARYVVFDENDYAPQELSEPEKTKNCKNEHACRNSKFPVGNETSLPAAPTVSNSPN